MLYMEKKIKLIAREECTGCRACSNVCPTGSISFTLNGLHYYPIINTDSCVECGKCIKACSPLNRKKSHFVSQYKPIYYCAWNEDAEERNNATSGGVSGGLAKHAINNGWYVCGAVFDDNWMLTHVVSKDNRILERIRGSKYLQSNTEGVYKEIVEFLKKGEKVLFLGTPCQTDALRNNVPSRYMANLLTCEIVCHGVNSPVVWTDYKNFLEKKYNAGLEVYNFRSKNKGWGKLRVLYSFKNGKKKDEAGWENIFHSWFGMHYMMRESCFKCMYRTKERYSDIIIGDFWGIEKIDSSLRVKSGASVMIENSLKAKSFLSECQLYKKVIDTQKALDVIKGFVDKMPEEVKNMQIKRMKQFEKDYLNYSFEKMVFELYPRTTFFEKYFKSVLYHLHVIR